MYHLPHRIVQIHIPGAGLHSDLTGEGLKGTGLHIHCTGTNSQLQRRQGEIPLL